MGCRNPLKIGVEIFVDNQFYTIFATALEAKHVVTLYNFAAYTSKTVVTNLWSGSSVG